MCFSQSTVFLEDILDTDIRLYTCYIQPLHPQQARQSLGENEMGSTACHLQQIYNITHFLSVRLPLFFVSEIVDRIIITFDFVFYTKTCQVKYILVRFNQTGLYILLYTRSSIFLKKKIRFKEGTFKPEITH
jgi:hypothetical protein